MTQTARYINTSSVPLSMAVFLATDNYDHDEKTISATSLIKPLRQLILGGRVPQELALPDLLSMVASRVGTAIHDGIERSWTTNYKVAMAALGYPQKVIDLVRINPTKEELAANPDMIAVYLEQRAQKQVGKYLVSGKFDFVGQGRLEDFKTTGTYSAMSGSNDAKYILQGSIYRWLNPDIITDDEMSIQFIFTDWSSMQARQNPNYPQQRIMQRKLKLMSVAETEAFVFKKLSDFDDLCDLPEAQLPLCTDEELWRTEPQFKWYKNHDATTVHTATKSTKNFDTDLEARTHMMTVGGGKGIVVTKPGQVNACKYCPGFSICTQKDALIAAGDLVL
jgi:hypothetical protein